MRKLFLILCLFISFGNSTNACCAAGQQKFYPFGELNGTLIGVEIKMSRSCRNDGPELTKNGFDWFATLNLSYFESDTMRTFKVLDTLRFVQKTSAFNANDSTQNYTSNFKDSFRKAKKVLNSQSGFQLIQREKYEYTGDTNRVGSIQIRSTDTSVTLYHKGKEIQLSYPIWGACGFLDLIQEKRTYRIGERKITIINVACHAPKQLPNHLLQDNINTWQNSDTPFVFTPTSWHGLSKDVVLFE